MDNGIVKTKRFREKETTERNPKCSGNYKRRVMRVLFILSFIIIPIVHFCVFYIYANFNSFIMAFQKPVSGKIEFCGLDNFKWVIEKIVHGSIDETEDLGLAFRNTFLTFGIQMIMLPVSLLISYFIYKKIKGYKVFRVLFYIPSLVSAVVVCIFYTELMGPTGPVAHLLQKIYRLEYLPSPLVDERFAKSMVFINLIWLGFPGNLIIWGGSFSRIPDSVIESARMDGVSWIREMFQIILPLVWPTFVLVIITSLAGMFGATGNVFLLTGGGKYGTQTLSNWMYLRVQQSSVPERSPNLYRVSAMGLMLTVVSCFVAFTVRRFMTSKIEETTY